MARRERFVIFEGFTARYIVIQSLRYHCFSS